MSGAQKPSYCRLIEAFRDATGVPIVLNTSVNENEPAVCWRGEAIECFPRAQMDALVLGPHVPVRTAVGRT
jgi:carbamoyltransferase